MEGQALYNVAADMTFIFCAIKAFLCWLRMFNGYIDFSPISRAALISEQRQVQLDVGEIFTDSQLHTQLVWGSLSKRVNIFSSREI